MMIDKHEFSRGTDGSGRSNDDINNNSNNNIYYCQTAPGKDVENHRERWKPTRPSKSAHLMNQSNLKDDSRKRRAKRSALSYLRPRPPPASGRLSSTFNSTCRLAALSRPLSSRVATGSSSTARRICLLLLLSVALLAMASQQAGGHEAQDYARIPAGLPELVDDQSQLDEPAPGQASSTSAPASLQGTNKESTRRKVAANKQRQMTPVLRVSESELLPFADFIVPQPAFSDLMKTWPPTTLTERNEQHRASRPVGASLGSAHLAAHNSQPSLLDEPRNHLNEDLDDTILTADQAFERDQAPEPPANINYLGELGDYLYGQLKQPTEASGEIVDELLDDFYYQHYQNSHTLYYGAQIVREGDIFEIGCYLPAEQAAEWTKSGRPLAANRAPGSPRVVRRTDYLGAKQNFTLKVFEATLVSSRQDAA